MALIQEVDPMHSACLHEVQRVLNLPIEVSGLRWHPFGLYTAPLAKRTVDDIEWSRRLHVWHPETTPVGEASPYGVHTHSGTARSHVVVGSLMHHLYEFVPDVEGTWRRMPGDTRETLVAHEQAETRAGMVHTLPANQAHGVSKEGGFAISLFEQIGAETDEPFTTWQAQDVPEEVLIRKAPVPVAQVQTEALLALATLATP